MSAVHPNEFGSVVGAESAPTHATTDAAARLNALVAVEHDPVRRAGLVADQRLAAAVVLTPRVIVAEALLAGVPVAARRLDPEWVRELNLAGDVLLDHGLALRVVARGPIETTETRRRTR